MSTYERGRIGLSKFQGASGIDETTDIKINAPKEIGSTYRQRAKSEFYDVEGSIPLGKTTLTLGGLYDKQVTTGSFPENKVGLPERTVKNIARKVSVGLGIPLNKDVKVSGFVDRTKLPKTKGKNTYSLQLSGKLKGNRILGQISTNDDERVGRFSLQIPFAFGGVAKPYRGRKAMGNKD